VTRDGKDSEAREELVEDVVDKGYQASTGTREPRVHRGIRGTVVVQAWKD